MAFSGWPAEAIEFYEGLAADNSKSYWQAHKAVYDELVHRPMTELLGELEAEFGEGKIFRPYRDVRFSRDKSPYKTAIGATLSKGGYVQFSAEGLAAGCGMYHLEPAQLDRFRRAVADDISGSQLAALVAAVRDAGIGVAAHDVLKTAPKGYAKDRQRGSAQAVRRPGSSSSCEPRPRCASGWPSTSGPRTCDLSPCARRV